MKLISQKELYGSYAKEAFAGIDAEGLLWGEEMYDTKLILYPEEIKKLPGYADFKKDLINVGIVEFDPKDGSLFGATIVRYNCNTDFMYMSENNFNGVWKKIRKSVALGIELQKESGAELQIERPEDIIDLSYLQRPRSEPIIKGGKIEYRPRVFSEEEKRSVAQKQRTLDDRNNLFFYSSDSKIYHDRDCECITSIDSSKFMASETEPQGYRPCTKCRRRLLLRVVCAPNVRQMPDVGELLKKANITDKQLQKYALEDKLKMRCDTKGELTVKGSEDTWIIKGVGGNGKLSLWHNNYIPLEHGQRYITDGFHNQKLDMKWAGTLLDYISGYTYEKHLNAKERARQNAKENLAIKENVNNSPKGGLIARIITYVRGLFLKK